MFDRSLILNRTLKITQKVTQIFINKNAEDNLWKFKQIQNKFELSEADPLHSNKYFHHCAATWMD